MKKIEKSKYEMLPPVYLYRDDFSELVDIFVRGCETVSIEVNGYELDTCSELDKLNKETINRAAIKGRNPSVSVEFKPHDLDLYIGSDNFAEKGIYDEIRQLLHAKRRRCFRLIFYYTPIILIFITSNLLTSLLTESIDKITISSITLVVSMVVLTVAWWFWTFRNRFNNYSIINTQRLRKEGTFFRRKKEELYLIIVTAIVSSAITIIVTKIFG